MLGLGASHLGMLTPSGYEKAALKHRVTAISALNKHLTKPHFTQQDAEAAFGAMLNLTFQSAYMSDGLIDFLTMVRGCWLVGTQPSVDLDHTIFKTELRNTVAGNIPKDHFYRGICRVGVPEILH